MDKKQFIEKLLNIYSRAFGKTDEGIKAKNTWVETCFAALPSTNCNYDRLWLYFLQNFDCRTIQEIPSAQWLYQNSKNYMEETERCEALRNIDNMPKGCPPPPEWYAAKEKFMEGKEDKEKDGLTSVSEIQKRILKSI